MTPQGSRAGPRCTQPSLFLFSLHKYVMRRWMQSVAQQIKCLIFYSYKLVWKGTQETSTIPMRTLDGMGIATLTWTAPNRSLVDWDQNTTPSRSSDGGRLNLHCRSGVENWDTGRSYIRGGGPGPPPQSVHRQTRSKPLRPGDGEAGDKNDCSLRLTHPPSQYSHKPRKTCPYVRRHSDIP